MSSRLTLLSGLVVLASMGHAQDRLIGARSLALSPDGSRLAFSYQGDIWVAPSAGGRAIPVASHVEMDDNPIWSPDGTRIAFASNRYGNWDTFVVSADGGRVRRVTYNSGSETPTDWTPDGKSVVFRGVRDKKHNGIYTADVESGKLSELLLDNNTVNGARILPDGSVLYQRLGFPYFRPRYEGTANAQPWLLDKTSGKRTLLHGGTFQHLWTNYGSGGSIYTVTVSEKTPSSTPMGQPLVKYSENDKKTPNVYRVSGGKLTQLTHEVGGSGTRYLAVARKADTYAFERDGEVYVSQNGKPTRIVLTASVDDKINNEQRQISTNGAVDGDLNAKGDTLVFALANDLWMVPVNKSKGPNADDATRLTDWAGLDLEPVIAPDGKSAYYVSDAAGNLNLWQVDLTTKKSTKLTNFTGDVKQLSLTPSKKKLTFVVSGKDGGMFNLDVATGKVEEVFKTPGGNRIGEGTDYDWSPDERFVAFTSRNPATGYYFWEEGNSIRIYDTQEKKFHDVTNLNSTNRAPVFSPDGKYLSFLSDREGNGIYMVGLVAEDARSTELEVKYDRPKATPKVTIDFEDISERIRRVAAGMVFQLIYDPVSGDLYSLQNGELFKTTYDGTETRQLTTGAGLGGVKHGNDDNTWLTLKGGLVYRVLLRAPGIPLQGISFRADWVRDLRRERDAAFQQFYRGFNRNFYDGNFHGRDWKAIRDRYQPLLGSIGHRSEMAIILNQMVGELESSHSEVNGGMPPGGASTATLGFAMDYSYAGPGIKVQEVPKKSPASYAKTAIKPGEIVTQVNGKPAELSEKFIGEVLNDQGGRDLNLTVKGLDGKERTVKYRSVSSGELSGLWEREQLAANKAMVEKLSGGKVSYVYIAGMGGGNLELFNKEYWAAIQGRKAMIIDVRGNGGGNISDRLIDMLERQQHSWVKLRDEDVQPSPGQSFGVPIVVMCDENSYSNAEMFPEAMKTRKLAKLVGNTTPGYVIWTGGFPLVDGTMARMPGTGQYRLNGIPMENFGTVPDYIVPLPVEDVLAGRDPQIAKAVEVLLKQVK